MDDDYFTQAIEFFGFPLHPEQKLAISSVLEGKDVFVILPTGFGKYVIYQSLPLITQKLVLVISPLVSLMKNQVTVLTRKGMKAMFIGDAEVDFDVVSKAEVSIVYGSPEAILTKKWRQVISSSEWSNRLVAVAIDEAHCIIEWGSDFRPDYKNLGEIRSLVPENTPFLALTATAIPKAVTSICSNLHLVNPVVIKSLPNRVNITYLVEKIKNNIEETFLPLAEKLRVKRHQLDHCIIYCRSVRSCAQIYKIFHQILGVVSYYPIGCDPIPENRLFGMFHHSSTKEIKEVILSSLVNPDGICRVVIATVALGMGFSSPNIRYVVHFGIPNSIEAYCQESGRAGRDNNHAHAVLLYRGCDLHPRRKIDQSMKAYCLQTTCRRVALLLPFMDSNSDQVVCPKPEHLCCDTCLSKCSCTNCYKSTSFHSLIHALPTSLKHVKPTCTSLKNVNSVKEYICSETFTDDESDSCSDNEINKFDESDTNKEQSDYSCDNDSTSDT